MLFTNTKGIYSKGRHFTAITGINGAIGRPVDELMLLLRDDEVLHKVLSPHPGVAMVNLRAFPREVAVNVMAFAAALPVE